MVISHRGNYEKSKFKENTMEALTTALDKKYVDGVELDVRLTQDNQVVIHHNVTIDETSDGTGFISLMTLNDLYQYNFGTKENPTKIGTLDNFLKVLDTDKLIMIEIKKGLEKEEELVSHIGKVIEKYRKLNIVICSFDKSLVKKFHQAYPKIKVGVITFFTEEKLESPLSFYSLYYKNIHEKLNYPYYIWTVNQKKELLNFKKEEDKKLLGIITDKPKEIYEYIHPVSL